MHYGIEAMRRVSKDKEKMEFVPNGDLERPEMSLEAGLLRALRMLPNVEDASPNSEAREEDRVREKGRPQTPRSR
jgi:hypothetical protein